jgi:hypothetical protein
VPLAELADRQRRRDGGRVRPEARVRPAPQPGAVELREAAEQRDPAQHAAVAAERPRVEVGLQGVPPDHLVEQVLLLDRGGGDPAAVRLELGTEISAHRR